MRRLLVLLALTLFLPCSALVRAFTHTRDSRGNTAPASAPAPAAARRTAGNDRTEHENAIPVVVDLAEFNVHYVDVVSHYLATDERTHTIVQGGDGAEEPRTRERKYKVAQLDVFFNQPMFKDGIPMADIHRFLTLHRHHRQVLYGLVQLNCSVAGTAGVLESYPTSETPFRMLFPLPASTESEMRWLNTLAGDFNYHLDPAHNRHPNRVSFATLLSWRDEYGREHTLLSEELLGTHACALDFLEPAEQRWSPSSVLAGVDGRPFVGSVLLNRSREESRHFHNVQQQPGEPLPFATPDHGGEGAEPDANSGVTGKELVSFLETGAILTSRTRVRQMDPVMSTIADDQLDLESKKISEYVEHALENELPAKVKGRTTSPDSPGAMNPDAADIFLEIQEQIGAGTRATPPPDLVEGVVTKNLITQLIADLTIGLSASLTQSLTDSISEQLHSMLVDQLKDTLELHLAASVSELVVAATTQTLSETIPTMLENLLPGIIVMKSARTITQTVTRALTHSLASSLTFTMKQSMLVEPYCYYCRHGDPSYCHACRRHAADEYADGYYLDFFGAFYSDYYADFFSGGGGEGEAEGGEGAPPPPAGYS